MHGREAVTCECRVCGMGCSFTASGSARFIRGKADKKASKAAEVAKASKAGKKVKVAIEKGKKIVRASTRSKSGSQIIKINNPGGGKNISQVQVSPDGGRHGRNPYVKISTTDQGIIKIVDGSESLYKTDGKETATIIFSGGN